MYPAAAPLTEPCHRVFRAQPGTFRHIHIAGFLVAQEMRHAFDQCLRLHHLHGDGKGVSLPRQVVADGLILARDLLDACIRAKSS